MSIFLKIEKIQMIFKVPMGFCSISPCLNGGKCFNVEADYECSCPDEYEGKNCQNIKDKCKLPNNKCTGKSKNNSQKS